jgi:glycosyltransferase involved in cell wall biosynthesis
MELIIMNDNTVDVVEFDPAGRSSKCDISVVIPVYNEENNLVPLYDELTSVLDGANSRYEILFVDDGSQDSSFQILQELHASKENIKVIQFRRNFGQTAAFAAGFDHARGDLIVTIDADGQNNPADIPRLIQKMKEGDYDLVTGWRTNRQEPFIRRMLSHSANKIISRSSGLVIHDRGCSLKLFKADLVKNIRLYGQLHRFLPELASMVGARVAEISTQDRKRRSGKSKYGSLSRTPRVVLDLVTVFFLLSFFTSPMRLFGSIAMVSTLSGVLIGSGLALAKIYNGLIGGWAGFHAYQIGNRPLLLLAILLVVVGIQFLMMGFLGEMIMRIYYEARGRPIYFVRKILD